MAEGVDVGDGNLETSQTPANVGHASGAQSSLPILLVVVGESLSEKSKDAVVKRIATGEIR